ncbi:MAG: hypothetical protein U9R79_10380 [Armatimonadota bacterium]|nr:hypothetical protein [Armatimonadota bacterium]
MATRKEQRETDREAGEQALRDPKRGGDERTKAEFVRLVSNA